MIPRRAYAATLALALAVVAGCSADDGDAAPGSDGGGSGAPSAATGGDRMSPEQAAAAWLVRQLDDGSVRDAERDRDDLDAGVDIAIALDELGTDDEAVASVVRRLEEDRFVYTRVRQVQQSGPAAKATVVLQTHGASLGRVRDGLEASVATDPAFPGRLRGSSADGMIDVVGQAYAVRAFLDAGSDEAERAASFLLEQQCEDGWFRGAYSSLTSTEQGCDGSRGVRADHDATAMVLLVLGPVADEVEGGEEALDAAADWLVSQQDAAGMFPGGTLGGEQIAVANAVSTGVAVRALGAWGRTEEAALGAEALMGLQLVDGTDAGAVAPDEDALRRGVEQGLGVPVPSQWRDATTAAAAALAWRGR